MKRTVVIGAGPAGLAAAVKLGDFGHPVTVIEAAPFVGGMARSFSLWGQTVDLGPHRFFSQDRIVIAFWRRFVGEEFDQVERLTRIYYGGQFYQYPLQALDALRKLGARRTVRALASYGRVRLIPRPEPRSFEDWVTARFGRYLFEIFFRTYTEKLWGIPCTALDADWAAQRIKKLSLYESAKAAVFGKGGEEHQTLLDRFAYPRGGSGIVYERMRTEVEKQGGEVRLSAPVARLLVEGGRVQGVQLRSGEVFETDQVVSTMPLTLLLRSLPDLPPEIVAACERLRFRNTILVFLEVDADNLFPDNWVYIHASDVLHGRITNFRNWGPSLWGGKSSSILCMEFWCFDEDAIWTEDAESLGRRAEAELRRVGLATARHRILNHHVVRVPRSYPVYEIGYQEPLQRLQQFVDQIQGLIAIGRYGAFKYNNQDHSLLMGLLAATEIHTGVRQQLWDINTDDVYQESATVSALFEAD